MKPHNHLTKRELQVLDLLSSGYSTPEISRNLFLSPETIKTYRKRLIMKLNAKNVAHLIRIGFENQLLNHHKSLEKINHQFATHYEMVA